MELSLENDFVIKIGGMYRLRSGHMNYMGYISGDSRFKPLDGSIILILEIGPKELKFPRLQGPFFYYQTKFLYLDHLFVFAINKGKRESLFSFVLEEF